MTPKDAALVIYNIVRKSVERDPVIQQLPEECHLEIVDSIDGFCEVYVGTHTIFNCYLDGAVTLYNNPDGQYEDYGEIPVSVPLTDESIGYAMMYLVQMRMLDEKSRVYRTPTAQTFVDISELVTPNKLLS